MNTDQYFAPLWLEVGHRKMEAEISLEKERVTAARSLFSCCSLPEMLPFLPSPFFPSPPTPVMGTLAFKKLHLLSSNFYNRAIQELEPIL